MLGAGGLFPVTTRVTETTMASDTSHPKMKPAPFLTPPFDPSTKRKAVRGIGSSVMTSPMRMSSKVTGQPI